MQDGRPLWSFPAQTGIAAGPVTFMAGGAQYVAVLAGAGVGKSVTPEAAAAMPRAISAGCWSSSSAARRRFPRLPPYQIARISDALPAAPPPAAQVAQGKFHYFNHCIFCHNGTTAPDLRFSAALPDPRAWQAIVHDGALARRGMVGWSSVFFRRRDRVDPGLFNKRRTGV